MRLGISLAPSSASILTVARQASRSFVLAALRALHLDPLLDDGNGWPRSRKGGSWTPAGYCNHRENPRNPQPDAAGALNGGLTGGPRVRGRSPSGHSAAEVRQAVDQR